MLTQILRKISILTLNCNWELFVRACKNQIFVLIKYKILLSKYKKIIGIGRVEVPMPVPIIKKLPIIADDDAD